ncbi:MAG: class I SAM-dependent methyltransferase, partial [Planctomycetota bacterium]|nr:class I SAM-dependent methyltransferase [Planctomycetota bacterium]
TGDLALAFYRAAPHLPVIALDFAPEMLALGRAKAAAMNIPSPLLPAEDGSASTAETGIAFCLADALALPLRDNSVAVASVAFGLRNVADLDGGLKEMVRVVRPGGKVLVLEFTRPAGWLFGPLYMFYIRHIVPLLGRLLSAAAGDAYRYLPQSVQAFAGPEEIRARMAAAGLRSVRATALTFGVVHLYVGMK